MSGNTRRHEKQRATSFSSLFTQGYDYLSDTSQISLRLHFSSPRLCFFFPPSQCMPWPVQPRPRLNCAISYVFTLLASFCTYFHPNISPHIILHFLYSDTPSLIPLCEPIPGPEDQNTKPCWSLFFFFLSLFGPSCGVFF